MKSTIQDVLDLADFESDDFTVEDIRLREEDFKDRILTFFDEYGVLARTPTMQTMPAKILPKAKIRNKFNASAKKSK